MIWQETGLRVRKFLEFKKLNIICQIKSDAPRKAVEEI
jgi:hypothetical protein